MALILRGGSYNLAPAAFIIPPESPPVLAGVPDDLVKTAASCGGIIHQAFTDVIDGGLFVKAPCLCCYRVKPGAEAEAGRALKLFARHYNPDDYAGSRVFFRTVDTLGRDLREPELAALGRRLAAITGPEEKYLHHLSTQLCVAVPMCTPNTLWVYSTGEGRRLLRHLARRFRAMRITVASSDAAVFPRHRYRMYAATGQPAATLLAAAIAWSRAKKRASR